MDGWRLTGGTEVAGARMVTTVGCKSVGHARVDALPMPGRAKLEIDYKAECDEGSFVRFGFHDTPGDVRVVPLSVLAQVMNRCPIDPAPADRLDVEVVMGGGFGCGGAVRISRISLVPARARWSEERCRWLWKGLASAAGEDSGIMTASAIKFVRSLPRN